MKDVEVEIAMITTLYPCIQDHPHQAASALAIIGPIGHPLHVLAMCTHNQYLLHLQQEMANHIPIRQLLVEVLIVDMTGSPVQVSLPRRLRTTIVQIVILLRTHPQASIIHQLTRLLGRRAMDTLHLRMIIHLRGIRAHTLITPR